jgi:hypothetical protein
MAGAMTSRPFLFSGVARKIRHAGQQRLVISPSHRYAHLAHTLRRHVSRMRQQWATATAEHFNPPAVWQRRVSA